ncbi:hypothetical protein EMCRGX_G006402 [Ephydatia muelleri]
MSTQKEIISRLACKALRLRLRDAHLSTTGKKPALVERLLQHEDSLQQGTCGLANVASDDSTVTHRAVTPPAMTPRLPEAARADGTNDGVIRRGIIRITAHWGAPFTTFTNAPKRGGNAKGKIDKTQRLVSDLPSWLEAWNKFVAIRVQTFPDTALAMLQYQSTICQLFSTFGPVAALKYDKLFRQAVARAKDQTLRWDNLKEDLLVWCVTNPPFRARQQTAPFPHQSAPAPPGCTGASNSFHNGRVPASEEVCRRFNAGRCHRTDCSYLHKCSVTGCGAAHPANTCPRTPLVAT